MRIVAGKFKGRPLITPADQSVRPTADRTRESLFNLIMHGQYGGRHIIEQPVADFCCGTGALGLEALSRGASSCIFLDRDTSLAKQNAERFAIADQCMFLTADVAQLPQAPHPCALILIDAPYHSDFLARTLAGLAEKHWLAPDALICVEQAKSEETHEIPGLTLLDTRNYGKASLRLYTVGK